MITWVGWIGIFLLTIGLLAVLSAVKRRGPLAQVRGALAGLLLTAVGALALGLRLALRGFEAFSRETLVAEAVCTRVSSAEFELHYSAAIDGALLPAETFRLLGDQWALSGGIVLWHPWLTIAGAPSYHKPTRLGGRFASAEQERAQPPSVVELNGGDDPLWAWFYRLDPWLPFVDAAYGSAAFVPVDPSRRFQVFVSRTGYVIKSSRR